MKSKVYMPVIFYRQNGKLRYDTHGTFDSMVSNQRKRNSCEFDFLSCFMANKSTEDGSITNTSTRSRT